MGEGGGGVDERRAFERKRKKHKNNSTVKRTIFVVTLCFLRNVTGRGGKSVMGEGHLKKHTQKNKYEKVEKRCFFFFTSFFAK